MWIREIFLGMLGLLGGALAAGGTFSLLITIGMFTRVIDVLRLGNRIRLVESALVVGGIFGNLISTFFVPIHLGVLFIFLFGTFSGMFVGWLVMVLAETLSVVTIVFRRLNLKYGVGLVVCSMAIGKMLGSLLYFFRHWSI